MNLRPIITDEQLRDFRDGLLPERERRLVAIQIKVDETISARFDEIKPEMDGLKIAKPSSEFSSKIMAQLVAENLVHETVYHKKSQLVIKSFFMIFAVLFIGSLLIALKSVPSTSVQLPTIDLQIDWAKIINGRAFLWAIWLGCLLPAILLVYRKFAEPENLVFIK